MQFCRQFDAGLPSRPFDGRMEASVILLVFDWMNSNDPNSWDKIQKAEAGGGGGRPLPALYLSVSPHMWPLREGSGGGEMTRRESWGGEADC